MTLKKRMTEKKKTCNVQLNVMTLLTKNVEIMNTLAHALQKARELLPSVRYYGIICDSRRTNHKQNKLKFDICHDVLFI